MLESREIAQTSLLLLATLSFLRDLDRVYEHELKRSRAESDKRQVSFANGRDSGESFFRFVIFVLIKAEENEDRERLLSGDVTDGNGGTRRN